MHIPDGYLGPATYGGFWAIMIPIWVYASMKIKRSLEIAQIPFIAMASVFSLVVMVFAIPLPGGTTGHLTGVTLIAILLGPWATTIAVSIALGIQALVLGEGGITALGANCFNIAFVGGTTGFLIYSFIVHLGSKLQMKSSLQTIAAGIAAYLSLNLAGLFTALELGLQPFLYPESPNYFPYPLQIAIPAIMIPHLTLLGIIEGTLTVLVFLLVRKGTPSILNRTKTLSLVLVPLILCFLPSLLLAHDYWIEKRGGDLMVVFGHGTKREEFDPAKIKILKAFDQNGREIRVNREKKAPGVLIKAETSPSLLFVEIDDGYWSRTIYGWKNLPKRKASRVVESTRSFFYSKALLLWGETATKPLIEAKLDLIPLENPFELNPGASLTIKVLYQGKPIQGVEIEGGDHQKLSTSDREGMAKVKLLRGHQVISASYKEPIKDDPDADALVITSTLTFEVTK